MTNNITGTTGRVLVQNGEMADCAAAHLGLTEQHNAEASSAAKVHKMVRDNLAWWTRMTKHSKHLLCKRFIVFFY